MEKATFQDMIARKMQKEQDKHKTKEIEVKSIGKVLVFDKPSDDLVLNCIEEIGDGTNIRKTLEAYKKLIYHTCALLQSIELQEKLEIIDPYDTVNAVFDLADILQIGEDLTDFVGFGTVAEEIKNS